MKNEIPNMDDEYFLEMQRNGIVARGLKNQGFRKKIPRREFNGQVEITRSRLDGGGMLIFSGDFENRA